MDLQNNITLSDAPEWLPEELIGRSWDFRFRYSRAERNIYRKRRKLPVSQWAEQHRTITMGSLQGTWKNSTTPYLTGVMDASFFPSVETVTICAADQVGKSECVNNCIGYAIDREPGPVLYVYPDEITARENSNDRILPMIESSPRLKSYLTGREDDSASFRINLQHMPIYMAWARSAARLANKPIKYIVFDETDKYPDTAGKREASPIRKGEKRLRTYRHSRKVWKLSTPTIEQGPIWQSLTEEAEVIFDFHVRCPLCGKTQRMVFGQIKWPEDTRDPKKVELEDLARYECLHCREKWDDYLRNVAVQKGEWKARENGTQINTEKADQNEGQKKEQSHTEDTEVTEKRNIKLGQYLIEKQPKRIGFHIPSWLSRFVGLSEVAASFLRGQTNTDELKDFNNSHAAEPWKPKGEYRTANQILENRSDYPAGVMPSGAVLLTAGVDVQKFHFYYVIRAWAKNMRSWLVDEGEIEGEDFDLLLPRVVEREVPRETVDGKESEERMPVLLTCIDSGYRTDEVYNFVRRHVRARAVKGASRDPQRGFWSSMQDVHPVTGRKLVVGVRLWMVDTERYKDWIFHRMHRNPEDENGWHVHRDISLDYAEQISSEQQMVVRKGWKEHIEWQPRTAGVKNHLWDAEVYACAAAHMLHGLIENWKEPAPKPKARDEKKEKIHLW